MAHKVQPSLSNISLNHDSGASSLQEQLYFKILDLTDNKACVLEILFPQAANSLLRSRFHVQQSSAFITGCLRKDFWKQRAAMAPLSQKFLSVYLKIERKVCQLMRNISPQNSRFLHKSQRRPLASKFKSLCPSQ